MTISNTELRPLMDKEKTELRERALKAKDKDIAFLHQRRGELVIERDRALAELREAIERRDKLATQIGRMTAENAALVKERDESRADYYRLGKELNAWLVNEEGQLDPEQNKYLRHFVARLLDRGMRAADDAMTEGKS